MGLSYLYQVYEGDCSTKVSLTGWKGGGEWAFGRSVGVEEEDEEGWI